MRKRTTPPGGPDTRDRVLDVALTLFNEAGMDRTTTRRIADTAGINEGNLYYHFRTKEALALALLDRLEAEAVRLLGDRAPGRPEELAAYTAVLQHWFMLTWCYRFVFRDVLSLSATPALAGPLRGIASRLQDAARAVFADMEADGLLAGTPGELDTMLANLWIVSGYWMSYLALRDGPGEVTPGQMEWGMNQVRSLYAPYLTEAARIALGLAKPRAHPDNALDP